MNCNICSCTLSVDRFTVYPGNTFFICRTQHKDICGNLKHVLGSVHVSWSWN